MDPGEDLLVGLVERREGVGLVGPLRVRPADELPLVDRVELREELREAEDPVGLRHHDEDGEADLEHPLQVHELRPDVRGLLVLLLGRVLEEGRGRDDHEDAVDRAVLAVLLEHLQEGRPLRRVGGRLFLEREPAGGVEDDRLVREPPVAVPRPARAGEAVAADGELEAGVLQRRRLARLRLADEEVPRERVDLEARPLELGERLGPLLRQLLDGLADLLLGGAGAALRVAGEVLLEGSAPRLVALLDEGVEGGDEERDDDEAADDGPPVLPESHRPRDDDADRHQEEDDPEGLDGFGETAEEIQKFVHDLPHSTPTARAAVRISLMSEPQRRKVRR